MRSEEVKDTLQGGWWKISHWNFEKITLFDNRNEQEHCEGELSGKAFTCTFTLKLCLTFKSLLYKQMPSFSGSPERRQAKFLIISEKCHCNLCYWVVPFCFVLNTFTSSLLFSSGSCWKICFHDWKNSWKTALDFLFCSENVHPTLLLTTGNLGNNRFGIYWTEPSSTLIAQSELC